MGKLLEFIFIILITISLNFIQSFIMIIIIIKDKHF